MNSGRTSKEQFFERLGAMADEMNETYGKDFALGALILTARFVAEGRDPCDAEKGVIITNENHGRAST